MARGIWAFTAAGLLAALTVTASAQTTNQSPMIIQGPGVYQNLGQQTFGPTGVQTAHRQSNLYAWWRHIHYHRTANLWL